MPLNKMNSDKFFCIGSSHTICEDYALSGKNGDTPYAIISDGCSSSMNTDFGARLLAIAASHYIDLFSKPNFNDALINTAIDNARSIGLPSTTLDATLLTASVVNDNVMVKAYGDGFIAAVYDNFIQLYQIEYPSGAPFYLNYLRYPERLKLLDRTHIVKEYIINDERSDIVSTSESQDLGTTLQFPIAPSLRAVAVMSDGIGSFSARKLESTYKIDEELSPAIVVARMLNFKNYNGVFVERRMKRFKHDIQVDNWNHYDDVSIGAIALC